MPEIGEIQKGSNIQKCDKSNYYIWQACNTCGKQRWVKLLSDGTPKSKRCATCTLLANHSVLRGCQSHLWKGGRTVVARGYIWVHLTPESPFYPMVKKDGYVCEHRLVMAKSLNRCLPPKEVVHHINGDTGDNRIENLKLFQREQDHRQYHTKIRRLITILENRITEIEEDICS